MSGSEMTPEEVAEASADTIRSAMNSETKIRFGEDFFVKHAIVIALVERPRGDLEKPNAERFSLLVKNLDSVNPGIAINMLREAAAKFQAKKAEQGGT